MVRTVLTAVEVLRKGLVMVGYDCNRQDKVVSKATNLGRFRAHYGSNPVVYAQIWEDLQIIATPAARIDNKMADADTYCATSLMCIHFLKCHPTEVNATKNSNTHSLYRRHICFDEPTTTSPGIWIEEKVRTHEEQHHAFMIPTHHSRDSRPIIYYSLSFIYLYYFFAPSK
jgi:GH25 family lysozyme M1 (1,4-beta-N-acetylmuramidase)